MDAGDVSITGTGELPAVSIDGKVYSFSETVQIGADYVEAYNKGLNFTMNDPTVVVDTSDQVVPGFFGSFGFKLGLGIGGGLLLIAGIVAAVVLLKRKG
jgi:hypothetical protein